VVHGHLADSDGVYSFKRSDGTFSGPVAGRVKIGETILETLFREIAEEAGVEIYPKQVVISEIQFKAQTPRSNKPIIIVPVLVLLPNDFKLSDIKLNGELCDFQRLNFDSALKVLALDGTREAYEGFSYLVGR